MKTVSYVPQRQAPANYVGRREIIGRLDVCYATVRDWLKTGKIVPPDVVIGKAQFWNASRLDDLTTFFVNPTGKAANNDPTTTL